MVAVVTITLISLIFTHFIFHQSIKIIYFLHLIPRLLTILQLGDGKTTYMDECSLFIVYAPSVLQVSLDIYMTSLSARFLFAI